MVETVECQNNRDCDTGYKCRTDPRCRGARAIGNPLCTDPVANVCIDNGGDCASRRDCPTDYTCIGFRNDGMGNCIKYQSP